MSNTTSPSPSKEGDVQIWAGCLTNEEDDIAYDISRFGGLVQSLSAGT